MTLEPHVAERPSWACAGCGQPWPCAPARSRLADEYDGMRHGLGLYLAGSYAEASADLYGSKVLVESLFDRFVGWQRTALVDVAR